MKFPIPSDWDGSTWCRWSVCWPASEGWEGFLRGLITLPMRGWTWDEKTGSVLDVQIVGREIFTQNLPLNGVLMACNDENLASAFVDIASAIRLLAARSGANGCCDTSEIVIQNSIQGFVVQPLGGNSIPLYGSVPPLGLGPGEFPPGYETEEEYDLAKCQVAHMIIDRLIKTLRDLGSITNFDFYALGGAVISIIAFNLAFPPALIPTLIAAMIVLAAAAYYLPQMADYIQDNRAEWICILYEGENTSVIIGAIADAADIGIAFITATPGLGTAIKIIVMVIMNGDNVNKLFEEFAAYGYPDADCTDCGCQELEVDLSSREFLSSYTWPDVDTYTSIGPATDTMVGGGLQLENPATPNAQALYRFTVDNPDGLEFTRIVVSNTAGLCCNFFFFVLLEDSGGAITNPFSSNGFAGGSYESGVNIDIPVNVQGLIIYVANSVGTGFDWTINSITLTCAV